ncbi:MAG: thioredoxin family protein [Bacteroidales bacterium]|nr:thioredoxin family protein [Bacteroidales bacterium]
MKISGKIVMAGLFSLSFLVIINAQEAKFKLYNPYRDANQQIDSAIEIAKKENKHVLLQIGGNWCSWCIMLHKFYSSESQVDSAINADYVVEYINFSKENKNLEVLKRLEFPQRFGFPVLVILDAHGKRLHTQNCAYLEEGRGYNKEKLLGFLNQWKPDALKPENYEK